MSKAAFHYKAKALTSRAYRESDEEKRKTLYAAASIFEGMAADQVPPDQPKLRWSLVRLELSYLEEAGNVQRSIRARRDYLAEPNVPEDVRRWLACFPTRAVAS